MRILKDGLSVLVVALAFTGCVIDNGGSDEEDSGPSGGTDADSSSNNEPEASDGEQDTESEIGDPEGITINETGFEDGEDESVYTQDSWVSDGFDPAWVQGFNQDRAHIDTEQAHTGNSSLRIDYPAGTYLPDANGAQVPLQFSPMEEVYASYWLMFSEDFDWGGDNEGGKLPGLGSGDNCSGGSTCDGTNGFSARLMWRTGGIAELYLYHMDNPNTYGEDIYLTTSEGQVYFQPGQWHQVVERVKINSGDNNDGEVQLWIDGEEALLETGLRFVNDGSQVDNLYFSTFHGGGDDSWAPSVDSFVWYDDLRIYYY